MANDVFALNKSDNRNLPLPDRIAEVRKQISELRAFERELTADAKKAGDERGAFFETRIKTVKQNKLNTQKLKTKFGSDLAPFYEESSYVEVRVKKLDEE